MTDDKTKVRAKSRQRQGLEVHLGDPVAGKDTLIADMQPISPNQSFEFSITEAKVQLQALETALVAGDEITVAITAPALTAAIEHAQRAVENSAPGRADEMSAELEPIERDAARLIARRDAGNLSADRLVDFAVKEIDGEQKYKVLFNVIVQAKNRYVLPQVAHELRARPHRVHGNYLDALTRLIRLNGSGGLRDLALFEVERAGVVSNADPSVVRMSGVERLVTAAKLGAPDIPLEVFDQLAGFLYGLPIAIGLGALIAAEVIPAAAVSLLMVPVVIEVANDLTSYRDLCADATTMGDLRAAGSYAAKVIAIVGVTALLAFIAEAKAGKAKRSTLRKPVPEPTKAKPVEAKPIAEPTKPSAGAPKAVVEPKSEPPIRETDPIKLGRAKPPTKIKPSRNRKLIDQLKQQSVPTLRNDEPNPEFDPNTPRHIAAHFKNEQSRTKSDRPRKWRNPAGYDAQHPNGRPYATHGEPEGIKLHWGTSEDNRNLQGKREQGQTPNIVPKPLP